MNRDIDEELQSHIDEAIEQGPCPRRGSQGVRLPLRHREASRDVRLVACLESLSADAIFAGAN